MIVIAGPRRRARDPATHAALPHLRPVRLDRRVKPGGDEGDHPARRRTARLILPRSRGRGTAHRRQAYAACAGLAAWSGGRGDFTEKTLAWKHRPADEEGRSADEAAQQR